MSNILTIICPVSKEKADGNAVRIIAGYTVLLTIICLYFNVYFISILLTLDFSARAFNTGKWSVLKFLAVKTTTLLKLTPKPIDAAPKKFAALLGMIFSFVILLAQMLHLEVLTLAAGGTLIFCAFLENVFNVCLGCYVYSFLTQLTIKND